MQGTFKIPTRFWVYPEWTLSWRMKGSCTCSVRNRRKRGDASVHMYSFNEAAVVYQDIQGRLNNDWFVLTALLSLVHQPHISASSSTFFLLFLFLFFLKKSNKITDIISTSPPSEMKITSPLYFTPLRPHCTSSVPLPHCHPNNPSSHIHTASHPNIQNEKQKLKKNSNRAKWKSSRKQRCVKSSLLLRVGHHFRDKADDGRGRLIGIHLGEQVTDVVCRAALLSGHKTKEPVKKKKNLDTLFVF